MTAEVHVINGAGLPVADAHTGVIGVYGLLDVKRTNEKGRATFALPQEFTRVSVYAWKPATGIDYDNLFNSGKWRWRRFKFIPGQPKEDINLSQTIEFVLENPITIDVRIVERETGAPLPGLDVSLSPSIQKPGETTLGLSFLAQDIMATTNKQGVARFDWLPAWNKSKSLTFSPYSNDYVFARGSYEPANVSGELTIALDRLVPISGQVRLPDGSPAADIVIRVQGRGSKNDDFRTTAVTDEKGHYELGVAPNMVYLLVVDDDQWAAEPQTGFAILPGEPRDDLDFDLRPATRIFGRVTIGKHERPAEGQWVQLYQYGQAFRQQSAVTQPKPEVRRTWARPYFVTNKKTDADGRYEFIVGPGEYSLRGPRQLPFEKFTITDETVKEVNFRSPREEKGPLNGLVVSGDPPRPVPLAQVTGVYQNQRAGFDLTTTTDANGRFVVERELYHMVMYARSRDGSLAGLVEIGPDDKEVTIPIQPSASVTAILIDQQTGQPIPDREIRYFRKVYMRNLDTETREIGGTVQTGPDGSFRLEAMLVGEIYHITVKELNGQRGKFLRQYYTPTLPGNVDLGRLELAPPRIPAPYKPPTLQERIAGVFTSDDSAQERLDKVRRDARLGHIHVLLVLADPDSAATEAFFKLRYEDRDVRTALDDYRVLAVPITGERADEALKLADNLGVTFAEDATHPRLVVVSAEGDVIANVTTADFEKDGTLDPQEVIAFLEHYRLPHLDGQQLLDDALARAAKENKRVIVQQTATWCGPCWSLSRFLDDHRETFEKDYIHVKMDHRWEHWEEVMDSIESRERGGVPWFAILDAQGNVLADSNGPHGNIGYPGKPEGIAHFLKMLHTSAIRLTDEDLARLEADLKQH